MSLPGLLAWRPSPCPAFDQRLHHVDRLAEFRAARRQVAFHLPEGRISIADFEKLRGRQLNAMVRHRPRIEIREQKDDAKQDARGKKVDEARGAGQ